MKSARAFLLLALAAAGLVWFHRQAWPTLDAFALALDHDRSFQQDFLTHYWPTGHQILTDPRPVAGYYYTAFFALLLAPLGALPIEQAAPLWTLLQLATLAAFVAVVRALLRLGPAATCAFALLLAASHPVLHNLRWGQVSVLMAVASAASVLALRERRSVAAGVLLAFAAAIKVYPALFALLFVFRRDGRALVAFVLGTLAMGVALPVALLGPEQWWAFEVASREGIVRAQWAGGDVNSQYFANVALRLGSLFFHHVGGRALGRFFAAAGVAAAIGCGVLAWRLSRRPQADRLALPLVALYAALAFVVRTSWPHYFAWLPLAQAALLAWCFAPGPGPAGPRRALAVLPLASFALSSVFGFRWFPDWNAYSSYGAPFVAQLPLLLALIAILALEPGKEGVSS